MNKPGTEDELIDRLLAGDEAAFGWLVDTYHAQLVRLARSFVKQRGQAEEVVQEAWEAVIKALPRFERRSSLRTWMFRILTNRAKTRAVREGRMVPLSAIGGNEEEHAVDADRFEKGMWTTTGTPHPWGGTPEDVLMRSEIFDVISEAIEKLPARQAAVVTMRDIQGLSSEEVCNVLEISETNQRVLLHRGRSKLRAALENFMRGRA